MPRYQVVVRETNTYYAEVDAETEEHAVEAVSTMIDNAAQFTDVVGEFRSSDVQVLEAEELILLPHITEVDEGQDPDGYPRFKAFCTSCEWSSETWHHATDYDPVPEGPDQEPTANPADLAHDAAAQDGADHAEES